MLAENKIRKRIKTIEMLTHRKVEEIEISEEEAKELEDIKEIDKVKLVIANKPNNLKEKCNFKCKEDCFAYSEHKGCIVLKDLYCLKEKCKFYRNDLSMSKIESDIRKYAIK